MQKKFKIMYLVFFMLISCEAGGWADVTVLNNKLRSFLDINDSIMSVDDELYRFFNMNSADITLSSDKGENTLGILFYTDEENVLPECLGRLINIHALFLSDNKLTVLPQYFTKFTSLNLLDLSSNNFNKLPEVLFSLKNLINLDLNVNLFECIENNIEKLENLEILNISGNNIKIVSKNLKKLSQLTSLNLSFNPNIIRTSNDDIDIEKDINFWKKLPTSVVCLYLNGIRLRHIPHDFNLSKLFVLRLANNFLEDLPLSFIGCFYMCVFDVSANRLTNIPAFIYHFKHLKELNLRRNRINGSLCLRKNMLSVLENLDLCWNNITGFEVDGYNILYYNTSAGQYTRLNSPWTYYEKSLFKIDMDKSLCIIDSLKTLAITINITHIVPNLLIFPNLLKLKIINKDSKAMNSEIIRSFFCDLQNMKTLENLELIGFDFIIVPKQIFYLKNLQVLSLKFCSIKKIPDEILTLPSIETINLSHNYIKNINPKTFESDRLKKFVLSKNSLKYLPSGINNNNWNFKLNIHGNIPALFKKDNDNIGLMDISYKKIFQIALNNDCFDNSSMSIEDLYNKACMREEYVWELNQLLQIKNKEVKEFTKDYDAIINHWNCLENYITNKNIKNKFRNYLQILYGVKKGKENPTSTLIENIKDNIKNYVEAIFEILIGSLNVGDIEVIERIIMVIKPGLFVCLDGQLQHFSYAYHLLIGDYEESNSIKYFIKNKIALIKYDLLREITTNNPEEENVHTFLYWQSELSETLGLPFFCQQYEMQSENHFLKYKGYVLYQFFKLMSVKNVIKDLREFINKTNKTITLASHYIYKNTDSKNLKEYVEYEGNLEYLKITGITEKCVYFLLEEMNLIKKS